MRKASGISLGPGAQVTMSFKAADNATRAIVVRLVTTLVAIHSPKTGIAGERSFGRAAIRMDIVAMAKTFIELLRLISLHYVLVIPERLACLFSFFFFLLTMDLNNRRA